MSVPLLPNPQPLYPVGDFGIARAGGPDANVDIDECLCGCCMYESDNGKD